MRCKAFCSRQGYKNLLFNELNYDLVRNGKIIKLSSNYVTTLIVEDLNEIFFKKLYFPKIQSSLKQVGKLEILWILINNLFLEYYYNYVPSLSQDDKLENSYVILRQLKFTIYPFRLWKYNLIYLQICFFSTKGWKNYISLLLYNFHLPALTWFNLHS